MEQKIYDNALENYIDLIQKINKDQFSSKDSYEILAHVYENVALLFYDM